jgi:hypothetical protein
LVLKSREFQELQNHGSRALDLPYFWGITGIDLLKKQLVDILAVENGHVKGAPDTAWRNVAE